VESLGSFEFQFRYEHVEPLFQVQVPSDDSSFKPIPKEAPAPPASAAAIATARSAAEQIVPKWLPRDTQSASAAATVLAVA